MPKLLRSKEKNKVFLSIIFLFFFNVIIFLPLFYPERRIIITPERVGSDNIKFHYPLKYFYQEKLKDNSIPLWSKNIGAGFPILAQSEIGVFNPINFLTLKFFDFFTAINLQFFLIYFLISLFSFYLARILKLNYIAALFFAVNFTFSSLLIFNSIHLSHMQTIVYFPLIFALLIRLIDTKKPQYFFILIPALTLQLFAGHYQYVLITAYFIFSYIFLLILFKKINKNILFILFSAYILSFLLGAIQLSPSLELLKFSTRENGMLFFNSGFPLSFLLTLFNPYYFGKVKNASYNLDNINGPWEGNLFIGFLGLIFFLFFLKKIKSLKQKINYYFFKILIIIFVLFLILTYSFESPLYFLFYLPPLNFFRWHSRFSLIVVFSLNLFAGFGFDFFLDNLKKLKRLKKTIIVVLIFLFLIIEKFYLFYDFNLIKKDKAYFKNNQINFERLLNSFSIPFVHYYQLLSKIGYKNQKNNMVYLEIIKNTDLSNYNLIEKKPAFKYESGIDLKRHYFFTKKIENINYLKEKNYQESSLSAQAKNLLNYAAIDEVSSVVPFNNFSLKALSLDKVFPSDFVDGLNYYYYKVKNPQKRIQFYTKLQKISTLNELDSILENKDLISTALIEQDFPTQLIDKIKSKSNPNFSFNILKDKDEEIVFMVKTFVDGFLVLADSYYPGWQAFVDGRRTSIYKANFLFRGLYLPAGNHLVKFEYLPESYNLGKIISFVGLVIYLTLIIIYRVVVLR